MSEAVLEILDRIRRLPDDDRRTLDEQLGQMAELEWQREAESARQGAFAQGLDQAAIDAAVESVRYGR